MTQDERDFILQSSRRVEWQENAPRPLDDTYCDMTPSELIRLVETLQQMLRESQAARKESEAARKEADLRNDELLARLGRMEESIRTLMADQQEKDSKLAEKDKLIAELLQTIKDRDAKISLDNQERFGSKSQKGKTKPKAKPDRTRQQDKDDFDGTSGSIPAAEEDPEKDQSADKPERTQAQRMADMLRKGTTYRKMKASNKVVHATDMSRLPAGAERNIRPLAGERKNSLFFGSHKMARASAIFHTAIATCRMMGLSAMDYFKTFFRRIVEGVADYTQLMPQTIGISANKC